MRYRIPQSLVLLTAAATAALSAAEDAAEDAALSVTESPSEIRIVDAEQSLLVYRKAVQSAPEGVDELFDRSGFIHPLRSPGGGVVTSIHAPDHYHHMGLWHAWVKTRHDGRSIDFWNIGDGTGGIRYADTEAAFERSGWAGFVVLQEHFARALGADASEAEVILEERLKVAARKRGDAYEIDYDTQQLNVSGSPLKLEAYRYGGPIAYRGPLHWDASNSVYLTSEGKGRADGHATRARWVAMSGPTEAGVATVAILCHPENRDAPQRIRIWDSGSVFFNYAPAQENAFSIEAGERSLMRYRVVVYDGEPDAERVEQAWRAYGQEAFRFAREDR